jgi:hypothetical protein
VTNRTNGIPDGLTCILSPTGNRTRDGRHDGAGVGPLHQKFGFRDNFSFIKFPSNIGDLNLGPPAFSATLVTNYTNGIANPTNFCINDEKLRKNPSLQRCSIAVNTRST